MHRIALIDLLAGARAPVDADSHRQVVENMIRILEAQRLINIDTIFDMADNLESLTRGERLNSALVTKLAAKINEIQLPRASLSSVEKNSFAFGYWTERHVEQQRKTILRGAVEKAAAGNDAERFRDLRVCSRRSSAIRSLVSITSTTRRQGPRFC